MAFDAPAPRLVTVPQLTEHETWRSPTSVLADIAGKVTAQIAQIGLGMTHQEWRENSFHWTPGDTVHLSIIILSVQTTITQHKIEEFSR